MKIERFKREMEKGKHLDYQLPAFGQELIKQSSHLSLARALGAYYALYEERSSMEKRPGGAQEELLANLHQCVGVITAQDYGGEVYETTLCAFESLRRQAIADIHLLIDLTDQFKVEEMLLNRVAYRFEVKENVFTQEQLLLRLSVSLHQCGPQQRDALMRAVIEQLPVRMTRGKFYSCLQQALAQYQGRPENELQDFIFYVKSACTLGQSLDAAGRFPGLAVLLETLQNCKSVTDQDQYRNLRKALAEGARGSNQLSGFYMSLIEAINPLYAYALVKPYVLRQTRELSDFQRELASLQTLFRTGGFVDIPAKTLQVIEKTEQWQEKWETDLAASNPLLDHVWRKHKSLLASLMQDKLFTALKKSCFLLSGHFLLEFDPEGSKETSVGQTAVNQAFLELKSLFEDFFGRHDKPACHAVMAIGLSLFPLSYQSVEEFVLYVKDRLECCPNQEERWAVMDLIYGLFTDEDRYEMA